MDTLTLARKTWGHLGQLFGSLDDGTKESKHFKNILDISTRTCIYQGAPQSFIYPFIPLLLEENNDLYKANVLQYPDELIQRWPDTNREQGERGFGRRYDNAQVFFDPTRGSKVIISRCKAPTLLGIFRVSNLGLWNPQLFDALSWYMAWQLAPITSESETSRDRLEMTFNRAMDKAKILDTSENEGMTQQSGGWTDFIDYNTPVYTSALYGNIFPPFF